MRYRILRSTDGCYYAETDCMFGWRTFKDYNGVVVSCRTVEGLELMLREYYPEPEAPHVVKTGTLP